VSALAALLACHLIRLDVSIGCVRLNASPPRVHAVLGRPTRVVETPPRRIGYLVRTDVYLERRVSVTYLLGGDHLYVQSVTTRDPTDRTARGVGVGSTAREVLRKVAGSSCTTEFFVGPYCRRPQEGGVGGTFFTLRNGRVTSVSVFAPAF
jgi:hypothetical protein